MNACASVGEKAMIWKERVAGASTIGAAALQAARNSVSQRGYIDPRPGSPEDFGQLGMAPLRARCRESMGRLFKLAVMPLTPIVQQAGASVARGESALGHEQPSTPIAL
jgi:hypothetical protein